MFLIFYIYINPADFFFWKPFFEICSHLSEKASKGSFRNPDKLQNHSNERKGKDKKKEQGEGKEEKKEKKKALVALLVFITETFSIRVFIENRTANRKMLRDHGLAVTVAVCSLQFTFEPQEGLPAVSDLRQGFLLLKIVREPHV